jgi:hypothetical protein
MDRRDRGVVAAQQPGESRLVGGVALGRDDARELCDLLRVPGDSGDGVAAAGVFGSDARAGVAGGADDGDLHGMSPLLGFQW